MIRWPIAKSIAWKICLPLALLSACAPLLEPGEPPPPRPKPAAERIVLKTLVDTRPSGLRCAIKGPRRPPLTISTPRLMPLSDFGPPVQVRCFGDGYWDRSIVLHAGYDRPLLHRVLDGERISIETGNVRGRDVASGSEFPNRIILSMRRSSFASEEERDLYYARLVSRTEESWRQLKEVAQIECRRGVVSRKGASAVSQPKACREGMIGLEQFRRADLRSLELERRRSHTP